MKQAIFAKFAILSLAAVLLLSLVGCACSGREDVLSPVAADPTADASATSMAEPHLSGNDDGTQPPSGEEAEPSPTPSQTAKPKKDVALLDAYEAYYSCRVSEENYEIDMTKLKKLRDGIYAGRKLSELLPNEQYNAKLLDFMIDEYPDNQYSCAIGPTGPGLSSQKQYPVDKEIVLDLNGDGVPERIQIVSIWDDEDSAASLLLVNGVEYFRFTSWGDFIPVSEFHIVDIDIGDNYREIAVSTGHPYFSYDFTYYFYYDGKKIVEMDSIQGAYLYKGDGTVTGWTNSWGFLYTHLPVKYKLDKNHMLIRVPEPYKLNYKVFVLRNLQLYTSRDTKSAAILMEKGSTVRITGVDGEEWTQITLASGVVGWIKRTDYSTLANSKEPLEAEDIFFPIDNSG